MREFHDRFGIRVLYTLPCYKDPLQGTEAGIVNRTVAVVNALRNESWIGFYDLCNEPDDRGNYFPGIRINGSNSTLGTLFPDFRDWAQYVAWQCGGWFVS